MAIPTTLSTAAFHSVPPVSDGYVDAQLIKLGSRELNVGTNDTGNSALEERQVVATFMTGTVALIIVTGVIVFVEIYKGDEDVSSNSMLPTLLALTVIRRSVVHLSLRV